MEPGQIVYAAEAYIVAIMSISPAWIAQPYNEFHTFIFTLTLSHQGRGERGI